MTVVVGLSDRIPRSVLRRLPKHALMMDFPPHIQAEIQRHLDRAARELRDQRDANAALTLARTDDCTLDSGKDEFALEVKRELLPVSVSVDREAGAPGS